MSRILFLRMFALLLLFMIVLAGCSGNVNYDPVIPSNENDSEFQEADRVSDNYDGRRSLLGLWQMSADPVAGTLDIMQLRAATFHLNALPFVEGPPLVYLSIESQIVFSGNNLDVDIGLRHPFLGLNEFTGFDVRGVIISKGSISGFDDTGLRLPWGSDTRLKNADGHTRWWNPVEFPYNTTNKIFGYVDGVLGVPDSQANFNATLNGYKYFSDDLGKNDGLDQLQAAHRGYFTAGKKNVRHYSIGINPSGFIFNYAIDASWEFPIGPPPWEVPADFILESNSPEPQWIEVEEIANTLWNNGTLSGGYIGLNVRLHSFRQIADQCLVGIEWPGYQDYMEYFEFIGDGQMAEFKVFAAPIQIPQTSLPLLISAITPEVGYDGLLPGKDVTGYYMYTADVSPTKPNEPPYADAIAVTPTTIPVGSTVEFDGTASYDPDGSIVSYDWESTGNSQYDDATGSNPVIQFNSIGLFQVDLRVTDNDGAIDTLDATIPITVTPPNDPPVAVAQATTATIIIVNNSVSFDGSASYDPDGTIASWEWEMGDDTGYDDDTGPYATIQFTSVGTYEVDLKVTDNLGATDTLNTTIQVQVLPEPFSWDPDDPDSPPFTPFLYSISFCSIFYENWELRYDPPGGGVYADTGDSWYFEESGTYGSNSAPDKIHTADQFNTIVTDIITVPNVPGNVRLELRHYYDLLYDDILGGEYMDGAQVRLATNTNINIWDTPNEVKSFTTLLYPISGPPYGIIGSGFINNHLNGEYGFRGPANQWYTSIFNLNPYKGQQVRMAYVFSSGFYALMGGCNWNGGMDWAYGCRIGKWEITTQ